MSAATNTSIHKEVVFTEILMFLFRFLHLFHFGSLAARQWQTFAFVVCFCPLNSIMQAQLSVREFYYYFSFLEAARFIELAHPTTGDTLRMREKISSKYFNVRD